MTAGDFRRVIFVFVLAAFLVASSGCTSYRRAALPGSVGMVAPSAEICTVVEGSSVRIGLRTGETVSGTVSSISAEELVLGGRGNYAHSDVVVRIAEIDYVEMREQSDGQVERGWFFGLFVAAVVGLVLSLPIYK